MWIEIKEVDPSYQQFLTPKQIREHDLSRIKKESPPRENPGDTHAIIQETELAADCCDDDTVILVLPPYEDSQFVSPDHYRNPHKLP
jgi:hypothetical protein